MNGRRALREEMQATWSVYDAARPIRKEDMAPPPEPARERPTLPAEPSPAPDGGANPLEKS